jgi:hypothetical protein
MMIAGMEDRDLLASCPDFLSIGSMLKATPRLEGTRRFIHFEASNEALDQQNEVVMQKALRDSADYFLRYGNIDIDHFTMIGAKAGIPDYTTYEIGRPVDVKFDGSKTMVKAEIYSGTGPAAMQANQFWSSLTEINPPARWYPSVGGSIMEKAIEIDPATKMRKALIKKVRWTNIGVSKTPVNQTVPTVAAMGVEPMAKSWGALGLDFAKALEASYATNPAQMTGGSALRMQSLDGAPSSYFDFRNKLAEHLMSGKAGQNPGARELVAYCEQTFGLSPADAAEYVERFYRDLKTGLNKRSKP